ncbi:MAG TPA: lysophospholipid acyltransferase family protein [Vicinamibacterales bacterium]|jgi:1-acyl-sn-glycerol-3-phosphate acyltransferase
MNTTERYQAFYADPIGGRAPRPRRAQLLMLAAGTLVSVGAAAILILGIVTALRARRIYARCATCIARAVLRLYGIRLRIHGAPPWPTGPTVYVSNHTSTLDLFVLVALGLPNTRFFLSGFLRRILPLGVISWMMGTFFTVPQSDPAERSRIFQRADATLRRTGESIYLSPEGERITTGLVGHFNKGAFHLATSLRAPIVPMYIRIPPEVDPRRGIDARPGNVDVYVLDPIDTRAWHLDDLIANTESVRDRFVRFQEDLACL